MTLISSEPGKAGSRPGPGSRLHQGRKPGEGTQAPSSKNTFSHPASSPTRKGPQLSSPEHHTPGRPLRASGSRSTQVSRDSPVCLEINLAPLGMLWAVQCGTPHRTISYPCRKAGLEGGGGFPGAIARVTSVSSCFLVNESQKTDFLSLPVFPSISGDAHGVA